jgi:hypothetical protein
MAFFFNSGSSRAESTINGHPKSSLLLKNLIMVNPFTPGMTKSSMMTVGCALKAFSNACRVLCSNGT